MVFTEAGRAFVERVAPALQGIEDAMSAARGQQAEPAGMLRIKAFASAARDVLASLVFGFLRRWPPRPSLVVLTRRDGLAVGN